MSGVTPTGFVRKTLAEIKSAIEAAQHASPALGAAFDVSANSPAGQLNGTVASELAEVWELLEECYHGFDVESAQDYLLTLLVSLTGTVRRAATASTVPVTCNLDAGATAPAGSVVAVDGRPDSTFTLDADITNPGGSPDDIDGTATCTATGPVVAAAGTLTVIVTSATGWNSVTNANDAILGRPRDNDIVLLQRQRDEIAIQGGSTVAAIKADVTVVEGVNSAMVLENPTDDYDVNGLPPHSVNVLVDDGDTPAAADDDIAQAIFGSKAAGIGTFGVLSGNATDANGDTQVQRFDRVTGKPVYFEATLTTDPDHYPADGDTQVIAAVVAAGQAKFGIGDDVIALRLQQACLLVSGVIDVPTFKLGFAPAPSGTANLVVGVRERATFNTANGSIA